MPKPAKEEVVKEVKPEKKPVVNRLVASEFNIRSETSPLNTESYNKPLPGEETKVEINLPDLNKEENIAAAKPIIIPKKIRHFQKPRRILMPIKRSLTAPIRTNAPHLPSQAAIPSPNAEINLGKMNALASDREVTIIECPGPEKFLLVKKAGKINMTNIKISQEEMERTIQEFSEKARIPLIDGIFKAIVGNMSINAIVANSIVHRFIIYKKTPYSVID